MVTRSSEAAAVPATFSPPLTLQRLLDTEQATAILPGILYFASTGQCLSTSTAANAEVAAAAAAAASPADAVSSRPSATAALATAAATAALHDFYYKENPLFLGSDAGTRRSAAAKAANAIPTARAAVGQDAAFVSLRGIPPYLYRPFFADFGPLDMGCCVHFARRLCELLRSVTGVDVRASLAAGAFASSSAATRKGTAGAAASSSSGSPLSSLGIMPTGTTGSAAWSHQPPLPTAAAVAPVLVPTVGGVRRPVVICAGLDAQERVNTACLVGAFCVLCLGWSAAATWYRGFADIYPGFLAYRDASQGVSNYPLSLLDVWSGLEQGVALGMVNVDTFDLPAFWRSKVQDCSWIVPRRFLAMSSPQDDKPNRTAEVYARRLRPLGVRLVVRLNDNLYSPSPLLRLGIRHVDLPYPDGSVPSDATLLRFLQAVETHFGESVAPVSLREWWTVSASGPGASSTPAPATASQPTSAATFRSGSVAAAKRAASAGGVTPRHAPVLQPCSLMHSGTCRGMPATCTAVPPTPLVTAARGRTGGLPGKRPLSSRSNPTSTAAAAAEPGAEDAAGSLAPGERGAVAVHCLAGLGRTGTMLAVYLMRHYGFTARAVIGWLRLCRPGSITGIQQQYLDAMERRLRPPPHMLVSLQLDPANAAYGAAGGGGPRFVTFGRGGNASPGGLQTLTSRPGTTGASAGGGAGGDAHALLPMGPRRLDTPHPPVTGGAGFQTHGSVLADARPATATVIVNGHIKRGFSLRALTVSRAASEVGNDLSGFADLATWHNISGGGSAYDLMRLRNGSTQHSNGAGSQQQQQQPVRRFSSTSSATLSFSTIRPEGAALDEVARMPVLGDAEVDKEDRSGSAATAAFGRSVTPTADDLDGHGGSASPRVGDYKYASTYFVAMEQAGVPPTSAMHQTAAAARDGGGGGGGGGGKVGFAAAAAAAARGGGANQRPATAGTLRSGPSTPQSATPTNGIRVSAAGTGAAGGVPRSPAAAVAPAADDAVTTPGRSGVLTGTVTAVQQPPQRQRPFTAVGPPNRPRMKRWQRPVNGGGFGGGGADADTSNSGSHRLGDSPPWIDLSDTAQSLHQGHMRARHHHYHHAAGAAAGGGAHSRGSAFGAGWDRRGIPRGDLDDLSADDIPAALSRDGGRPPPLGQRLLATAAMATGAAVPHVLPHVPPQTQPASPPRGAVTSSVVIPVSSLPMWGRPLLRT